MRCTQFADPRAVLLKELAGELVAEKGCEKEFAFLELLEQRAIECFKKVKGTKKQVCSNVDFYSGFIYELMGLPHEIYTPLFAMARIVGWTAHRIEELNFEGRRIIRPAYKNVLEEVDYKPIGEDKSSSDFIWRKRQKPDNEVFLPLLFRFLGMSAKLCTFAAFLS